MEIKLFSFPTFEQWVGNDKNFRKEIGEYRCEIRRFCWGNNSSVYMIALSLSNVNPLNLYTEKLFCKTFDKCDDNEEEFKNWYYDSIKELNFFWKDYIKSTYFEEE